MSRLASLSPSLWIGLAGGCFMLTIVVYFRYGFASGFLPLLCGVYAARRGLSSRAAVGSESERGDGRTGLTEHYEIETDEEYTADEQIELLSDVRSDYCGKHRIWGGLATLCAVVGVAAIVVSVALAVSCFVVAGYCGVRWYRVREALSVLDTRIDALVNNS